MSTAVQRATMRAVVQHRYGSPDQLTVEQIPVPTPGPGQVLVRMRAASVNPYDCVHVLGTPYMVRLAAGLRRPRQAVRGVDLAGRVEALGEGVTRFRVGDDVFGMVEATFADHTAVDADKLVRMPAGLSFTDAAAVPLAALTALQGLRHRGGLTEGQNVLVNGASGGVGTYAVQIAKAFGAEVTGVCSPRNVDAVAALGADHVIDYTSDDFVTGGRRYDLILDIAGNRTMAERRRVLTDTGTLVVVGGPKTNRWVGPMQDSVKAVLTNPFVGHKLTWVFVKSDAADLQLLADLIAAGKLRSVVERTHPLAEAPGALSYVWRGHARGKIVLTGRS